MQIQQVNSNRTSVSFGVKLPPEAINISHDVFPNASDMFIREMKENLTDVVAENQGRHGDTFQGPLSLNIEKAESKTLVNLIFSYTEPSSGETTSLSIDNVTNYKIYKKTASATRNLLAALLRKGRGEKVAPNPDFSI